MNSRAYIGKSFWDSSRRAQSTVAEQSLAPLSDEYEGPGHGEVVGTRILRYSAALHCAPQLLRVLRGIPPLQIGRRGRFETCPNACGKAQSTNSLAPR